MFFFLFTKIFIFYFFLRTILINWEIFGSERANIFKLSKASITSSQILHGSYMIHFYLVRFP